MLFNKFEKSYRSFKKKLIKYYNVFFKELVNESYLCDQNYITYFGPNYFNCTILKSYK